MPDSSDQTIRRLQQEIKKLKKTLGQKGKELEQKNEELDLERGLWKTRHGINIPVNAGAQERCWSTAPTYPCAVPARRTEERRCIQARKRGIRSTQPVSATNNIILGIGSTVVGKTHDITLLREDPIPFGRWAEKMHDGSNPKSERFTAYMDLGYQGMQKDLLGANVIMPYKRPRRRKGKEGEARNLTDEQKKRNKKVGGIKVTVENSIGRIKQYARMTEPYGGTEDELNCEMNVVAGLVNLHLMKTLHRGSPKLRRRFLG